MADGAPRRRPRLVRPGAALAVAAIIVAMMASTGLITSANHQQIKLSDLGQVAAFLAFAAVGVVVAWHQPRNPMGWVLLGVSFFFLLDDLASSYAYLDYRLHGGRLPIGWLAGLSLLLFPDGRVPSSRWRPMLWAYLALGALWLGVLSPSRSARS
jgi:two-component system, NarL family, sensor kinase